MTNGTRTTRTSFSLGQIVSTPGALGACAPEHLLNCLQRHARGDWGSICDEDRAVNDDALVNGDRLLSAYPIDPGKPCEGYGENCLWIITEADRSVTPHRRAKMAKRRAPDGLERGAPGVLRLDDS